MEKSASTGRLFQLSCDAAAAVRCVALRCITECWKTGMMRRPFGGRARWSVGLCDRGSVSFAMQVASGAIRHCQLGGNQPMSIMQLPKLIVTTFPLHLLLLKAVNFVISYSATHRFSFLAFCRPNGTCIPWKSSCINVVCSVYLSYRRSQELCLQKA